MRFAGQEPILNVVLDAVIFADGQFEGPDKGHSFDTMSLRIDTEAALARRVSRHEPDIWAELENLAKVSSPQLRLQLKRGQDIVALSVQQFLARDLINIENQKGEEEALKVADHSASLPKLWK